ncbi:MAG: DNA topoisomerase I [Candidatus Nanoarchaeia archaeon]
MANILIIAEKPAAAQKIAYALGDTKILREGKIKYFISKVNGDNAIIVSAVGHLFTLAQKKGSAWPVFDLEWKPIWEVSKKAYFAKQYAQLIEKLAKQADKFILACDYDIEGEVIGLNILRFLCHRSDAARMRFSTLTPYDLKAAYDNLLPTLDWGQAEAGETRHYLDWLWGINLSKAAILALGKANVKKVISIGRVQGPALAILATRELEIRNFIPKPYWQISILLDTKPPIEVFHSKKNFWDENEAKRIFNKIKNKPAKVSEIKTDVQNILPPVPFDLTTLQMEAWRTLKFSPKLTQQLAQDLYTAAAISYPRTSSQKLPPTINYKKIILELKKQTHYSEFAELLLKSEKLKPRQGTKTDPAHPAIYPTGVQYRPESEKHKALYDLIVRRFFATFGQPAQKQIVNVVFEVEGESFCGSGSKILEQGWRIFYQPYLEKEESKLPSLRIGELITQKSKLYSKKTEPPKRYTPASIIKELERKNLGTKSTRAQIIDTLYKRGYIIGTSIEVTNLGLKIVETFQKYAPDILSEDLTRHFELDMESIREKNKSKEIVIREAKNTLVRLLNQFNLHINEIGQNLAEALKSSNSQAVLMKCPKCKIGEFKIIESKKTKKRFLACSRYPECKTTWPLPQNGLIKFLKKKHSCGALMVQIIKKGKPPWTVCPNPECTNKNIKKD